MKATTFLALLVLCILVAPWAPDAQQATKVPRIGWLHPGLSRPALHPSLEDFRQGPREHSPYNLANFFTVHRISWWAAALRC